MYVCVYVSALVQQASGMVQAEGSGAWWMDMEDISNGGVWSV